jgi:hypothetical protein
MKLITTITTAILGAAVAKQTIASPLNSQSQSSDRDKYTSEMRSALTSPRLRPKPLPPEAVAYSGSDGNPMVALAKSAVSSQMVATDAVPGQIVCHASTSDQEVNAVINVPRATVEVKRPYHAVVEFEVYKSWSGHFWNFNDVENANRFHVLTRFIPGEGNIQVVVDGRTPIDIDSVTCQEEGNEELK